MLTPEEILKIHTIALWKMFDRSVSTSFSNEKYEYHRELRNELEENIRKCAMYYEEIIYNKNHSHIIEEDGTEKYFKNGKLHRETEPAITYPNGRREWYTDGELDKERYPAVITENGTYKWYSFGKLHNRKGPAIVYPDGSYEFWIEGIRYNSEEEFKRVK
jgi:hypothetical protein